MDIKKLFTGFRREEDGGNPDKKGMDKTGWILLVLLGILLFVIAMPIDGKKEQEDDLVAEEGTDKKEGQTCGEVAKGSQMEERLELALSNMDGVGKVRVMITYKDNGTQVVEKDKGGSSGSTVEEDTAGGTRKISEKESEETTVYSAGGDGEPFIAKELLPEIEGILIVAEGADKTVVKQNILKAVLALFPVEAHKIMVVKMND